MTKWQCFRINNYTTKVCDFRTAAVLGNYFFLQKVVILRSRGNFYFKCNVQQNIMIPLKKLQLAYVKFEIL